MNRDQREEGDGRSWPPHSKSSLLDGGFGLRRLASVPLATASPLVGGVRLLRPFPLATAIMEASLA